MLLTSVIACIQCICVLPKCQITLQGSWKVSGICRGPNKAEKKKQCQNTVKLELNKKHAPSSMSTFPHSHNIPKASEII